LYKFTNWSKFLKFGFSLCFISFLLQSWSSVTFLVRPEAIVCGADLCFTADVYLLFISTWDLRDALADRRKILHADQYWAEFYNAGPKFLGVHPQKFYGLKHAKFGPILDNFKLWQRISLERMKIFKIRQVHFVQRFLLRLLKEVWWTLVHKSWRLSGGIVPTHINFLEDYIAAPKGCCTPNFYTCHRMTKFY